MCGTHYTQAQNCQGEFKRSYSERGLLEDREIDGIGHSLIALVVWMEMVFRLLASAPRMSWPDWNPRSLLTQH